MKIAVVNKHHGTPGEYIGRGSPLGNPFSSRPGTKAKAVVASREEAIAKFREYLWILIREKDPAICVELNRLYQIAQERPLNLVCFCAPKPCHGDVVRELLLEAHEEEMA